MHPEFLLLTMKKRYSDKPSIISQQKFSNTYLNELQEEMPAIYRERDAYQLAIIKITVLSFTQRKKEILAKIERLCKCKDIQFVCNEEFSNYIPTCINCSKTFSRNGTGS